MARADFAGQALPINLLLQTTPDKARAAIRTAYDEIAHFTDPDYFTNEELESAKTILESEDLFDREKPSEYVHTISFWWASAGIDYFRGYLTRLRATSRADIVRYVTMGGEEGLWPLKLDPPDGKSNRFNKSALTVLEQAEDEKWVRIRSTKKHYTYSVSRKTFEETPPQFSDRSFDELINEAFKDRVVTDLNHEIWDVLENGSDK